MPENKNGEHNTPKAVAEPETPECWDAECWRDAASAAVPHRVLQEPTDLVVLYEDHKVVANCCADEDGNRCFCIIEKASNTLYGVDDLAEIIREAH